MRQHLMHILTGTCIVAQEQAQEVPQPDKNHWCTLRRNAALGLDKLIMRLLIMGVSLYTGVSVHVCISDGIGRDICWWQSVLACSGCAWIGGELNCVAAYSLKMKAESELLVRTCHQILLSGSTSCLLMFAINMCAVHVRKSFVRTTCALTPTCSYENIWPANLSAVGQRMDC